MLAESLLLLVFLLLGYAVQLAGAPAGLRDVVWVLFFWTFSPVLVFVAFLTVDLDEGLGRALAAAILASWLVGLGGYGYARLVAGERDERGALTLAAGFGNTGFVGFPLAQLAYGADGLALAALYDRLSWLVPASSVSTAIARVHGRREVEVSRRHRLRAVLANPPLHAFWLALVLRAAGVDVPGTETAQDAVGAVLRADVPGVFYLLAGMPSAFHLLVLARVYDVRPTLLNRIVVGTTIPAVTVVVLAVGLLR